MKENSNLHRRYAIAFYMLALALIMGTMSVLAWFQANKNSRMNDFDMEAIDLPFELKTMGTVAPNSSLLEEFGYVDGKAITGGASTEEKGDIKWLLAADDNMAGDGLRPGTEGSLAFIIDPVEKDATKNLVVTYTLQLTAYKLKDEKKAAIIEAQEAILEGNTEVQIPTITMDDLIELSGVTTDPNYTKAIDYIKGHILFFKNADYTGRFQLGETQTVTFNASAEKNMPIHWIWPDTIGDMVQPGEICFGSENTSLVTYIQNNPDKFFQMNDLDSDMLVGTTLKSTVLGSELTDYYPILNLAYNDADQVIGVNVQYILIELIVDGKMVDAN